MSDEIIGLQAWFQTPAGQYLLAWEQRQFDDALADVFGYHALQLGLPGLAALQGNRMPHRWLAGVSSVSPSTHSAHTGDVPGAGVVLVTDFAALPFPEASLDLVVLPHTLDSHGHPHAVLREVARVLVPGGRVALSGFNPASLWGIRNGRERLGSRLHLGTPTLPASLDFIGARRLRDWLHLLDFEIETGRYGCYRPLMQTEKWLQRWQWMDQAGQRWWPFFGAAYVMLAVKRVYGVRLMGPAWKRAGLKAAATVPLARRDDPGLLKTEAPPRTPQT